MTPLIALGRAAGFSLDEIAQMFASDGNRRSTGRCSQLRRLSSAASQGALIKRRARRY
jgi:MerR-like DNA binding protein